uniref:Uncharacterized protein n=1 Tax=Anguilla anguilla TaxID=7936 RepID=A0A0E9VNI5_ANGAN
MSAILHATLTTNLLDSMLVQNVTVTRF